MARTLLVMPSWIGDAVMATPAIRLLRERLPGHFIGALVRPGIDEVLAGLDSIDEFHVERAAGVMGPKFAAAKVRPRRYDAALLLTNSFSTALVTRLAGIPRRVGFDRDARGFLLTETLQAPRDVAIKSKRTPIAAVDYYWAVAAKFLDPASISAKGPLPRLPEGRFLELATTERQEQEASALLERAGVRGPFAVVNPGGNNEVKRWPAERFGRIAAHLSTGHGLSVLINGSPAERAAARAVADAAGVPAVLLPELGVTVGALKALVRRARVMVTNDTGPRYFAAAFDVPHVVLYGPTDPRWTVVPSRTERRRVLVANPDLPRELVADDHPELCRVDRISVDAVLDAVDSVLGSPGGS